MHSCLYTGQVRHRRFQPKLNEFRYSISFLYLDLDELDLVLRRLPMLGMGRWGICSLRFDERLPMVSPGVNSARRAGVAPGEWLSQAVRGLVAAETGKTPDGPIRWLTLWGSVGFFFAPVSFYFCFAADGETVESVVAEVSNTPWRERHCYVLWQGNREHVDKQQSGKLHRFSHAKEFHVSPFMELGLNYRWGLTDPSLAMTLHLEACRDQDRMLDATLSLKRTELTRLAWLRSVARYPVVPLRVLSGIYFEAMKLWINKTPFFPHPRKQSDHAIGDAPKVREAESLKTPVHQR